jgi:hypothetical protein
MRHGLGQYNEKQFGLKIPYLDMTNMYNYEEATIMHVLFLLYFPNQFHHSSRQFFWIVFGGLKAYMVDWTSSWLCKLLRNTTHFLSKQQAITS